MMRLNQSFLTTAASTLLLASTLAFGCGESGSTDKPGNTSSGGSSGKGGSSGSGNDTGGEGGEGTSSGKGGTTGSSGKGGTTGSGGKGGTTGSGGKGGSSGSSNGGTGNGGSTSGGNAGEGGDPGTAGTSGNGGTSGTAGTGGDIGVGGDPGGGEGGETGGDLCISHEDCADGVFCNGEETCQGVNAPGADARGCVAGTPPDCVTDNYACTTQVCDPVLDACDTVLNDAACDDGKFCNGPERCDPTSSQKNAEGCVVAADNSLPCGDGIGCTTDVCNEATDECDHIPDDTKCWDFDQCDGDEICDPQNAGAGNASGCIEGEPLDCTDNYACTVNTCLPLVGCYEERDDSVCENADPFFCDGAMIDGPEICDPDADPVDGCADTAPVACGGGNSNPCRVVSCSEVQLKCVAILDSSLCEPGEVCTNAGCVEQTTPCNNDAECDDGVFCNGQETCDAGECVSGTPPTCNDNVGCTVDKCDIGLDDCVHTPNDSFCDDNDVCNGEYICDSEDGCVELAPPLSCDNVDGKECTVPGCHPVSGCFETPNNALCADDLFCNGIELCDPATPGTTGCKPGNAVVCAQDSFSCTTAMCNEATDQCVQIPDDTLCLPPGSCTNGTCTCSPGSQQPKCVVGQGCVNNCTVATCGNKSSPCGDCKDNDGDCLVDADDESCLGVCIMAEPEDGFVGPPASLAGNCEQDCYFDTNQGGGGDCTWDFRCDPKQPNIHRSCPYNPNLSTCTTYDEPGSQPSTCHTNCDNITPNGCDCFGCCYFDIITNTTTPLANPAKTIYLGTMEDGKNPSCTVDVINDQAKCSPCTQNLGCFNDCQHCEICPGKPLPPDCTEQICPVGKQKCGLDGQAPCPNGQFCVTGCCQPLPT